MPDHVHASGVADAERPGFAPERLVRLMRQAIARLGLDLDGALGAHRGGERGLRVDTPSSPRWPAPSGSMRSRATRVTGAAPSLPGRRWRSRARPASPTGSRSSSARPTTPPARAYIVTNSGNLRPLDAELIGRLPSNAVIALMYEAWELRQTDIDLRGVPPPRHSSGRASTNGILRSGVFPYLGCLAVRELHDAGFAVHGCRIGLLCDNGFAPYLQRSLESLGGEIGLAGRLATCPTSRSTCCWSRRGRAARPLWAPLGIRALRARLRPVAARAVLGRRRPRRPGRRWHVGSGHPRRRRRATWRSCSRPWVPRR